MTAITKLIIGGFKSIRDRKEIPIAPLTFLFGPNSSGKSVLLEAMNALRQRLQEKPPNHPQSSTAQLYEADDDPFPEHQYDPRAHRLSDEPKEGVPQRERISLGVEVEDFGRSDCELIGGNEAQASARAVLWALDGSRVQIEVSERARHSRDGSSIHVDDQLLFSQLSPNSTAHAGISDKLYAAIHLVADPSVTWMSGTLGSLVISLTNPVWSRIDLKGSQVNFDRVATAAPEMKKERLLFKENLTKLKSIAERTTSALLQQLVWVKEDQIIICTEAGTLHAEPWYPDGLGRNPSGNLPKLLRLEGIQLDEQEEDEYRATESLVDWIICATNGIAQEIAREVSGALNLTAVSGDRSILKSDDVIFEREGAPWLGGNNRGPFWDIFCDQTDPSTPLKGYAYWLAKQLVQVKTETSGSEQSAPKAIHGDFINDVLRTGFLMARGYQVTPAVWRIDTTTLLNPGEERGEESGGTELKIQLFLKDANGRLLNFSEVGSGISYVMPVLAALWGASRSWIAQPELHLHPAAQCEMGDAIIRAFNRGRFSVTETHSEHLLLRVLRRIRQTSNSVAIDPELKCIPEAVSVLYFDPQDDGSTQIRQLRVTRLGDFKDRWPNGFFEERGRELFDE